MSWNAVKSNGYHGSRQLKFTVIVWYKLKTFLHVQRTVVWFLKQEMSRRLEEMGMSVSESGEASVQRRIENTKRTDEKQVSNLEQ